MELELSNPDTIKGTCRPWYVVRSVSQQELAVAERLLRASVQSYVPLRLVERQHRRTKAWKTWQLPLLPGYLFISAPPSWAAVLSSHGVIEVLGEPGRFGEREPFPVSAGAVERLATLQAAMAFDDTRAARLRRHEIGSTARETSLLSFPVGVEVLATAGPLTARAGRVVGVTADGMVETLVRGFDRLVSVTFPPSDLQLIAMQ